MCCLPNHLFLRLFCFDAIQFLMPRALWIASDFFCFEWDMSFDMAHLSNTELSFYNTWKTQAILEKSQLTTSRVHQQHLLDTAAHKIRSLSWIHQKVIVSSFEKGLVAFNLQVELREYPNMTAGCVPRRSWANSSHREQKMRTGLLTQPCDKKQRLRQETFQKQKSSGKQVARN